MKPKCAICKERLYPGIFAGEFVFEYEGKYGYPVVHHDCIKNLKKCPLEFELWKSKIANDPQTTNSR